MWLNNYFFITWNLFEGKKPNANEVARNTLVAGTAVAVAETAGSAAVATATTVVVGAVATAVATVAVPVALYGLWTLKKSREGS